MSDQPPARLESRPPAGWPKGLEREVWNALQDHGATIGVADELMCVIAPVLRAQPVPAVPPGGERWFPIQPEAGAKAHPMRVPWSVAEKAWSGYAARYGSSQSLERMAQRGGFHPSEMDEFFPAWREEAGEISALKAALAQTHQQPAEHLDALRADFDDQLSEREAEHAEQISRAVDDEQRRIATAVWEKLVPFGIDATDSDGIESEDPAEHIVRWLVGELNRRQEQAEAREAALRAELEIKDRAGAFQAVELRKAGEQIAALRAELTEIRAITEPSDAHLLYLVKSAKDALVRVKMRREAERAEYREELASLRAELKAEQREIAALTLKVRLYENGRHGNQPLVDDIERFRQEAEQAMRQRDSTQGVNNKLRKELDQATRS